MTIRRIALPILLAALAAGCAHTDPAKLKPEESPYLTQGRIQFESSTTKRLIDVVGVDTERVAGGLLKVNVTFRNRTKGNLWCDMRTTFLDEKGHVLEQTNWEPVLLDFRTVSEYTCTSMGPQAADYQIIIRKPNKSSLNLP